MHRAPRRSLAALVAALVVLTVRGAAAEEATSTPDGAQDTWIPADIALVHKARLAFWVDRPKIAPLSINVLGAANYGVTGLEVGGVVNYSYGSVTGIQVAGITNIVSKDFTGLQASGIVNVTDGDAHGVMVGFLGNSARKSRGITATGIFEYTFGDGLGVHVAGFSSHVRGDMDGLQVSLWNVALGSDSTAIQIAIVNSAHSYSTFHDVGSTRIVTTTRNTSTKAKVTGMQAGLVNLAYNVDGLQVGFMNVTEYGGRGIYIGVGNIHRVPEKDGLGGSNELTGFAVGALGQFGQKGAGLFVSGLYNVTTEMKGVQIAPVNVTKKLEGLQIGVVNIATEAPIPVLPVVNFGW